VLSTLISYIITPWGTKVSEVIKGIDIVNIKIDRFKGKDKIT